MTALSPPDADSALSRRAALLSGLWVLAFFSNVPLYVGTFVFPPLQPLHWIIALLVPTMLMLIGDERLTQRPLVFPAVLAAYACVCLAWYVGQGGGDLVVLRQRMLGLIFCSACYLVFTTSENALLVARKVLLVVVIGSVLLNLYDISHPYVLIPAYSEFATVGRAAGLFINPNQAGTALVLGLVLSIRLVPPRWRVASVIFVASGVAVTWSRSAMLSFAVACFGLTIGRHGLLTRRQVLSALVVGAAAAWATWLVVAAEIEQRFNIDPAVVIDRLLWILDPSGRSDFSQTERLHLMQRGLDQFLASPLWGNGIGSTELWAERTSTHNLYVMLASDFGVLGLFVLPVIVIAAMGGIPSQVREVTVGGLIILIWGLFSHNVLGEFYVLVSIAMLAALAGSRHNDPVESRARIQTDSAST
jgi:O-antigen ligase